MENERHHSGAKRCTRHEVHPNKGTQRTVLLSMFRPLVFLFPLSDHQLLSIMRRVLSDATSRGQSGHPVVELDHLALLVKVGMLARAL